ncbi:c-type cytochrome [Sphingomonas nostoxanthinifaciens]|uniref:c-type cytochrome n=1 Tax=Sphingomonas nostoxanthinifaciens TaxID=2872652 RepID=UPI001CC1D3D4|nr:c-type cytochrome [Sphingomonas nostoxanthinifaciens]UAK26150.1 c-type cytochrome [Sphingomonas nostoxanthinifaciens]
MKKSLGFACLAIAAPALAAPLPKPASFAICGACHKVEAGAPSGVGPNLWQVGGRTSGTLDGYDYSPAMKAAKIKWTKAELVSFISGPQARVPGTKMAFGGIKNPADASAVADYLLSLK